MSKKYKILICDDEKDIVDVLAYNLLKEGFLIEKAFNGQEALMKLTSDTDLVLLDVMMPYLDGLEVCRRMKENPETRNISIIFLTAKNSE